MNRPPGPVTPEEFEALKSDPLALFWRPAQLEIPEAPEHPSVAQMREAHAQARACPHRGAVVQGGCNCLVVCLAGPVGKGRENPQTGWWEASLGECVECVSTTREG